MVMVVGENKQKGKPHGGPQKNKEGTGRDHQWETSPAYGVMVMWFCGIIT